MRIFGIDYGSKLAGTTSIVLGDMGSDFPSNLQILRTSKKVDADEFILKQVDRFSPKKVFIDAPLSLPKVYSDMASALVSDDFFYRLADKQVQAMSPLFLGGLTARAMKLKVALEAQGIEVFEVYPAQLAKHFELSKSGYKTLKADYSMMQNMIIKDLGLQLSTIDFMSSHDFDAFLAFLTGVRKVKQQAQMFGNEEEGCIWV